VSAGDQRSLHPPWGRQPAGQCAEVRPLAIGAPCADSMKSRRRPPWPPGLAAAARGGCRMHTISRASSTSVLYRGHWDRPRGAGDTRTDRHSNSHVEQDHQGTEQRHSSTGGLKSFVTAARFCLVCDEIRTHLRPSLHRRQPVTPAHRRHIHRDRFAQLMGIMAGAPPRSGRSMSSVSASWRESWHSHPLARAPYRAPPLRTETCTPIVSSLKPSGDVTFLTGSPPTPPWR
jgi:hypothetical protein